MQPVILSMEVYVNDSFGSESQLRIENDVKCLIIARGSFDRERILFLNQPLPHLLYNEEWIVAHILRDKTSSDPKTSISNRTLAGVKCRWRHTRVDCLKLEKTKQLTAMAFKAVSHSIFPVMLPAMC